MVFAPPYCTGGHFVSVSHKKTNQPVFLSVHLQWFVERRICNVASKNSLSNRLKGTLWMTKLRPVDQLRELLLKARSARSGLVERFFQLNSPSQACATSVMLACSKSAVDVHVAAIAADAFFLYF